MKKTALLLSLLAMACFSSGLFAQGTAAGLQLQYQARHEAMLAPLPASSPTIVPVEALQPSAPFLQSNLLPAHVRANPSGFTYLCRIERKLENRSPVSMWVKVGDNSKANPYTSDNARVQLKLLRF